MLSQLGACQFSVAPFNYHETDNDVGASFAFHGVLGKMPDPEFVGEDTEKWSIRGRLFPEKFGGMSDMAMLRSMCRAGVPQFYMRGDGVPLGWVVIELVTQRATYIGADGVGRVIEFEANLKSAGTPSADGIFNALVDVFR